MHTHPSHARRAATLLAALAALITLLASYDPTAGAAQSPTPTPTPKSTPASTCQNPAPTIDTSAPIMSNPAVAAAVNGLAAKIAATGVASSLPGFSVGVIYDQDLLFAAGFGCANIAQSTAATPQTIYHIESLTKVFDATMMMQLRDLGKFQLSDQVSKYVPAAYYKDTSGATVSPTFLELSSHTAGLPDQMYTGLSTPDQFFAKLETQVVAPPPWQYSYSDIGFVTLGQSDAIIANTTYHDWMDQKVFDPLSMTNTVYGHANATQSLLAVPYSKPQGSTTFHPAIPAGYEDGFPPAGSIFTNVPDMAQFIMLQFRTGPAGGNQILASTSIQEMWQPVATTQGSGSVGIGWFINPYGEKYTMISKNGGDTWWSSLARMIPELKLGVVAFANTGFTGPALPSLETAIFSSMVPALAGVTPTPTPTATPTATPTSSPAATPTASPTATPAATATPSSLPSPTPLPKTPEPIPTSTPTPTPGPTLPPKTPVPDTSSG